MGLHNSTRYYATPCPRGTRQLDALRAAYIQPRQPSRSTFGELSLNTPASMAFPHSSMITDNRHIPPRVRRRLHDLTVAHTVSHPGQLSAFFGCSSSNRPQPGRHVPPRRAFLRSRNHRYRRFPNNSVSRRHSWDLLFSAHTNSDINPTRPPYGTAAGSSHRRRPRPARQYPRGQRRTPFPSTDSLLRQNHLTPSSSNA